MIGGKYIVESIGVESFCLLVLKLFLLKLLKS